MAAPEPQSMAPNALDRQITGLDALELAAGSRKSLTSRFWSALWPAFAAVAIALAVWQLVVLSGRKEPWVLPGPTEVLPQLGDELTSGTFWAAVGLTMRRALIGYALSIVIGVLIGAAVSRVRVLRAAVGSMITGLQTMPSIAWFPLAILLFQLTEGAILFVVVLGAAPSVANGLVAGELLVLIAGKFSLGQRLQFAAEFSDGEGVLAAMMVIFFVGVVVDAL